MLAAAATLVVLLLSLVPVPTLPLTPPSHTDKLIHVGLYAVLAGLWRRALPRVRWVHLALALIAYGAAIEFLQGCTANRSASLGDGLANTLGVLIMLAPTAFRRHLRPGNEVS